MCLRSWLPCRLFVAPLSIWSDMPCDLLGWIDLLKLIYNLFKPLFRMVGKRHRPVQPYLRHRERRVHLSWGRARLELEKIEEYDRPKIS